jgi:hypothetical protein
MHNKTRRRLGFASYPRADAAEKAILPLTNPITGIAAR